MRNKIIFGFVLIVTSLLTSVLMAQPSTQLPVKLYNDNGDNFVVIAHRGASAYHPENTMSAFRAAVDMGAEMIELDVLLSKDGVPVVIHDETLERTTDGRGKVEDYNLRDLKKLDAGSWFSSGHKGEGIPTLEEVLNFAKGRIAVNIEIKTEAVTDSLNGGIEEKALKLVYKHKMQDYVLFSSFDYRAIAHLRELDVDISTALLYEKSQSEKREPKELVSDYKANAFNCSQRQFSKKWAEQLNEQGIPVFIYTVNKTQQMRKVIELGASGIFSDKPDVLKKLVDNLWKRKEG
ncbi:glycerophosphoryl diester phosphodiesterase [Gracilimonas mengyeensis]|uniref:Glycerophosphoryl diester phosphodiesterase n=2 Tax=Gracilimonas mengyeensis TaxID=1302730 RepID=A0A521F5G1_9BACT|nr:glycerophosphoryl diester phosphodiesterase [Gracilimonas mengyeensis]